MSGETPGKNTVETSFAIYYKFFENMGITGIDPDAEVILHAGI